jgi:hypothetical protein
MLNRCNILFVYFFHWIVHFHLENAVFSVEIEKGRKEMDKG